MQDNYPKYTSRKEKNWFVEDKVEVIDWPAHSPDLNLIENLWTDVKEAVYHEKPKNQRYAMLFRLFRKRFLLKFVKV